MKKKTVTVFLLQTPEGLSFFASLVSALLALVKLALFLGTGSYIIAVSAWDSFVDSLVSLVNRFVIRYARTEADADHPYGHGKAESLAAMGQGLFVTGGGVILLWSSSADLLRKSFTDQGEHFIWLILFFLFCALTGLVITRLLEKGARFYQSLALESDAVHYRVDTVMNFASAVAFALLGLTGWKWLDPLLGASFSLYILFLGLQLVLKSVRDLMDTAIEEDLKEDIIARTLELSPEILNVHDFRGRRSGNRLILDFHAALNQNLSFQEAHELVEKIEEFLAKNFQADPVVHADPEVKIFVKCT